MSNTEHQSSTDKAREALAELERHCWRMGELWGRYQGVGWPDKEGDEFTKLRDETVPALRASLADSTPSVGAEGVMAYRAMKTGALYDAKRAESLWPDPDDRMGEKNQLRPLVYATPKESSPAPVGGQAASAVPTEPGWYVVLPPDFDEPTVRAFGKDGQWWIPLGRGDGADGWMSGREYKNWVGPIADIDASQPFLASPTQPASAPAREGVPDAVFEIVQRVYDNIEPGALAENRAHIESIVQPYLDAIMDELRELDATPSAPAQPPKWYAADEVERVIRHEDLLQFTYGALAAWVAKHLQLAFEKGFSVAAARTTPPAPRAPSIEPVGEPLTTCNCRWQGEEQVQQCKLHEAHVDAIHEWAERAKTAEKALAAPASAGVEEFPLPEPKPPNEDGKTLCTVRWVVELPNGMWLGAWDKEAFAAYSASLGHQATEGKK